MDFTRLNPVVRSVSLYEKIGRSEECVGYDCRLIYIVSGDLSATVGDKKLSHMGPGNLIYIPAGVTHHIHKLDAPSGTAITLAEGILENLDRKERWVSGTLLAADGTLSGTTACAADELPVSSIREGEVPGIHSIRYDSEADSITITHDAKSRRGFALGAVLAAEYTATHEGLLGMSDLFDF